MKVVKSEQISNLPRSMCRGDLSFGDGIKVACHVLDDADRTRVLSARDSVAALTGAKDGNFARRIERLLSVSSGLELETNVRFVIPNAGHGVGIRADDFVSVCEAYADALVEGRLRADQEHIGRRAYAITRGLARRGIEALVDEATGFQKLRAEGELQTKFAAYLRDELAPWERAFPPEFYGKLARVYRQKPGSGSRRPGFMGQFTRRFVYEATDPDVAHELAARIGSPERGNNYHQLLTDRARAVLVRHIDRLYAVLRQSDSPEDFRMRFDREFRGGMLQQSFGRAS
jgi:hypothetical protein